MFHGNIFNAIWKIVISFHIINSMISTKQWKGWIICVLSHVFSKFQSWGWRRKKGEKIGGKEGDHRTKKERQERKSQSIDSVMVWSYGILFGSFHFYPKITGQLATDCCIHQIFNQEQKEELFWRREGKWVIRRKQETLGTNKHRPVLQRQKHQCLG